MSTDFETEITCAPAASELTAAAIKRVEQARIRERNAYRRCFEEDAEDKADGSVSRKLESLHNEAAAELNRARTALILATLDANGSDGSKPATAPGLSAEAPMTTNPTDLTRRMTVRAVLRYLESNRAYAEAAAHSGAEWVEEEERLIQLANIAEANATNSLVVAIMAANGDDDTDRVCRAAGVLHEGRIYIAAPDEEYAYMPLGEKLHHPVMHLAILDAARIVDLSGQLEPTAVQDTDEQVLLGYYRELRRRSTDLAVVFIAFIRQLGLACGARQQARA